MCFDGDEGRSVLTGRSTGRFLETQGSEETVAGMFMETGSSFSHMENRPLRRIKKFPDKKENGLPDRSVGTKRKGTGPFCPFSGNGHPLGQRGEPASGYDGKSIRYR